MYDLKLLVGPNDVLVAVWWQGQGQSFVSHLMMAEGDTSGNWGPPLAIAGAFVGTSDLDATIDIYGNMLLAWIESPIYGPAVVKALRVSPLPGTVRQLYALGYQVSPVQQLGTVASSSEEWRTGPRGPDLRLAGTPSGDAQLIWLGPPGPGTYGSPEPIPPTTPFSILVKRYFANPRPPDPVGWELGWTRLDSGTSPPSSPTIAVDSNGNALASWSQDGDCCTLPTIDLHRACYTAASHYWFGRETYSQRLQYQPAANPNAIFDSAGNLLVIWSEIFEGDYRIMTQRFNRVLGSWEQPQPRSTLPGAALLPMLAASVNNGEAYAVWNYTPYYAPLGSGPGAVYGALWDSRAGWGPTERIDRGVDPAGNPNSGVVWANAQIAMAPDGEALAVWSQTDGGVYARYRDSTGVWNFGYHLASTTTYFGLGPLAVVMDSHSRGTVMWIDPQAEYTQTLWARRFR
jgi:hypothetical protein